MGRTIYPAAESYLPSLGDTDPARVLDTTTLPLHDPTVQARARRTETGPIDGPHELVASKGVDVARAPSAASASAELDCAARVEHSRNRPPEHHGPNRVILFFFFSLFCFLFVLFLNSQVSKYQTHP
jgi:hypothetical protein